MALRPLSVAARTQLAALALAGASYGASAVLLQQLVWNLLLGGTSEGAPSFGTVLVLSWASILVTNTIWSALLGLLAAGMRRLLERRSLRRPSGQ